MAAWVADPIQRWLGDCLTSELLTELKACDDLARALGSRVETFRDAISKAGPSRRRLAPVVDKVKWAFRADDLEREWPRYRKMDVRARVDPHAIVTLVYTQVETVVGASVVGTIYSD